MYTSQKHYRTNIGLLVTKNYNQIIERGQGHHCITRRSLLPNETIITLVDDYVSHVRPSCVQHGRSMEKKLSNPMFTWPCWIGPRFGDVPSLIKSVSSDSWSALQKTSSVMISPSTTCVLHGTLSGRLLLPAELLKTTSLSVHPRDRDAPMFCDAGQLIHSWPELEDSWQ